MIVIEIVSSDRTGHKYHTETNIRHNSVFKILQAFAFVSIIKMLLTAN